MTNTIIIYICNKCNKTFKDLSYIPYQEYAGSYTWKEEVSPCCHSTDYREEGENL